MSAENSLEAFAAAAEEAQGGTPVVAQPQETPAPAETPVNTPAPTEEIITDEPSTPEETPSPAEQPIDEPQTSVNNDEPQITEERVKEVEKIVEKVVEKYPEIKSEQAKQLYDAIINGDDQSALDALIEYGREKKRDYGTMSDLDVIKTTLRKKNPSWTKEDIALEIEEQYGDLTKLPLDNLIEGTDEYDDAVRHNKRVDRNMQLLSRDSRDSRQALLDAQSKLELPKIENKAPETPKQEEPSAEAIAEANRIWEQQVEEQTKDFGNITVRIGDRQVTYKLSENDKQAAISSVKGFNPQEFFKQRGWIGEDGKTDALKIAQDIAWLTNKEKIVNAYSLQAENNAKKEVIKDIKNINPPTTTAPSQPTSFVDAFADAWEGSNKR